MADDTGGTLARLRNPLAYVMGAAYLLAGIMHFVAPKVYAQIIPPALPRPLDLVYLSGIAEIGLGLGMFSDRTRRYSAWGIIGLLVAVFPANVYMATSDVVIEGVPEWVSDLSDTARWVRLPLQGVLILWAWWYTKPAAADAD
jgi:uncharacterized membrane protein